MFGGPNNGEIYEFNTNEMKNGEKEILIGRTPDCDVKINDKLLLFHLGGFWIGNREVP